MPNSRLSGAIPSAYLTEKAASVGGLFHFNRRWNHLLGSRFNVTGVHIHAGPHMTEKFASPQVFIRRHTASPICDVVVLVRGQEMVLHCPSYSQALKWARLECKSYKISESEIRSLNSEPEMEPLISKPDIEPLGGLDHEEELPSFLRSPPNN
jgi:hypothetical protein